MSFKKMLSSENLSLMRKLKPIRPLLPNGSLWKGTLMLEYPDVNQRKRELSRLIDVQDRIFVVAKD